MRVAHAKIAGACPFAAYIASMDCSRQPASSSSSLMAVFNQLSTSLPREKPVTFLFIVPPPYEFLQREISQPIPEWRRAPQFRVSLGPPHKEIAIQADNTVGSIHSHFRRAS
jgi:hypothetical protein